MDLDRYRALHSLQQFAESTTVLAQDQRTKHQVLLTSTDLSKLSPEQQQMRQQGLARLRGLRHPAVPTLLDYTVENSTEWRSHAIGDAPQLLSSIATGNPCDRDQILEIVRGVLWGLHALESCDLHHGQLHTANIVLTDGGHHLVLTNPQLHHPTRNHRIHNAVRDHSVGFLAPELVIGHPSSITSDIYAIGVLMHTLATGSNWLNEAAPIKPQFHQIISGLHLKVHNDPELQQLIDCCTAHQSNQRPQSAEMLLRQMPTKKTVQANETASSHPLPSRHWPKPVSIQAAIESAPPAPVNLAFNLNNPPAIANDALQGLKQAVQQIRPLPEIWFRIEAIMNDPASGCGDLALEVEKDPILTSHILNIANSPAYAIHGNRQQTDIAMAITRLGMDTTQGLLLEKVAPQIGNPVQSNLAVRSVWLHAQAISLICRTLSTELINIDNRLAGTVGLLHDIGKLIIIQHQPADELERLRVRIACGMPELQAEYDQLGFTHIDAGMMLALHWHLPRNIHTMIRLHHHPDGLRCDQYADPMQQYTMLVHSAHLLLQQLLPAHEGYGIWQASVRCRSDDLFTVLDQAGLRADTEEIVLRIDRELSRLLLRFPDIIKQPNDKEQHP